MKLRNKNYIRRKKALRDFFNFTDLRSMLQAGLALSRSRVVQRDINHTLSQLEQRFAL